jgi:hypothetical protein
MICKLTKSGGGRLSIIFVTVLLVHGYGCNSNRQSAIDSPRPKQIVDIQVTEAVDAWQCIISGNTRLSFSALNNLSPTGLLLYFPGTRLGFSTSKLSAKSNEMIGFLDAEEFVEDTVISTRLLIGLSLERPYSISPAEADIVITFPKVLADPIDSENAGEPPAKEKAKTDKPLSAHASLLKQVTVVPMKDYMIIYLESDGTIREYRSFAINDPARIVFDLNNIESRLSHAPIIPIDSQWVKRIRYNSYPDKVRLVLDTETRYLTTYFSFSTESGLLIYVGKLPQQIQNQMRFVR